MHGKMQASGLPELIPFIHCLRPTRFLVHLRSGQWLPLALSQLFSNHHGGWFILQIAVLGALIHNWRPELADGSDISCLLLQQIFSFPSSGSESASYAGHLGSVSGSGRSPGEREWLPTPVFLPGEFHGWRSLAGYSPWSRKESDTTEQLTSFDSDMER